jgi:hypothetical protein
MMEGAGLHGIRTPSILRGSWESEIQIRHVFQTTENFMGMQKRNAVPLK